MISSGLKHGSTAHFVMAKDFQKLKALKNAIIESPPGTNYSRALINLLALEYSLGNNNKDQDAEGSNTSCYLSIPFLKALVFYMQGFMSEGLDLIMMYRAVREQQGFLDLVRWHGFDVPDNASDVKRLHERTKYALKVIDSIDEATATEDSMRVVEDYIYHCIALSLRYPLCMSKAEKLHDRLYIKALESPVGKRLVELSTADLFSSEYNDRVASKKQAAREEEEEEDERVFIERSFLQIKDRLLLLDQPYFINLLMSCEYGVYQVLSVQDGPRLLAEKYFCSDEVMLTIPYLKGKMLLAYSQWSELECAGFRMILLEEAERELEQYISMLPHLHSLSEKRKEQLEELIVASSESLKLIDEPIVSRDTCMRFFEHCYCRAVLDLEQVRLLKCERLKRLEEDALAEQPLYEPPIP